MRPGTAEVLVFEHPHAEPGPVRRRQVDGQPGPQRDPLGSVLREHRLRRGGPGRHALARLRPRARTAAAPDGLDPVPPAEYRRRRSRRIGLRRPEPGYGRSEPASRSRAADSSPGVHRAGRRRRGERLYRTVDARRVHIGDRGADRVALRDGGADAETGADRGGIPRGARCRAANRDRRPVHRAAAMRRG